MFHVLVGGVVNENGVRDGRRSEGEEVIEVSMGVGRKRWRGSERVFRAGGGTRRVSALKALTVLGMAASVS